MNLLSSGCWLRSLQIDQNQIHDIQLIPSITLYIYVYIHITFVFLQAVFCSQKTNHETWLNVSRQVLGIGGKFFQWSFHPGWLLLSYCWWFRSPTHHLKYIQMGCKKKPTSTGEFTGFLAAINSTTRVTNKNRKQLRCADRNLFRSSVHRYLLWPSGTRNGIILTYVSNMDVRHKGIPTL